MIDYLHRFADEGAAMGALPAFVSAGLDGPGGEGVGSCVLPGVSVYRPAGVEIITDPEFSLVKVPLRDPLPGWHVIIARPERDGALEGEACVLIADRDSGDILFTITTPEDLAGLRVEPIFTGSEYPFGAPVVAG